MGTQPAGGQRRATIPDLFGTNQPEGRLLREPLSIVEVFISSQAAIDGLLELGDEQRRELKTVGEKDQAQVLLGVDIANAPQGYRITAGTLVATKERAECLMSVKFTPIRTLG